MTVIKHLQADRFHIIQLQISHVLITLLPDLPNSAPAFVRAAISVLNIHRAVFGFGTLAVRLRADMAVCFKQ